MVEPDPQVAGAPAVAAQLEHESQRRAAAGQAPVLQRGELVDAAGGEDGHRQYGRCSRVATGEPASQPRQPIRGKRRQGPHDQVAGSERGQPQAAAVAEGARVQRRERRHRRQHHGGHHQRPDGDERADAQAHGPGHRAHVAGHHHHPGPRASGRDQQQRGLRRQLPQARHRPAHRPPFTRLLSAAALSCKAGLTTWLATAWASGRLAVSPASAW